MLPPESNPTGRMGGQRRWLGLILLSYLALALALGAVNPLFEAPDEQWHYFTAQTISETGRLPFVAQEPDPWTMQEAAQPPLYYLLASLIIAPLDTDRARELVWPNPHVRLGDASSPTNTNAFVHTEAEAWPWRRHVLAAHLLRAFSALMGLGTLLCIFAAARLIWPAWPERALLATAMAAFLPQFVFLHSAISNDPLIVLLASAGLWQLLRLWQSGVNVPRLIWLGLTVALAMLTKTAGLLLLFYSLGFLSVLSWRQSPGQPARALRQWLGWAGPVLALAMLLAGWLLWRNWALYGDVTATNQFIRLAGGDRQYTLLEVVAESSGLWTSLFAVFGWFNVRGPLWIYLVWNGLALAALAGAIWSFRRAARGQAAVHRRGRFLVPGLLAVWLALVYAGLVRFMLFTPAAQGRLLLPALVPLALAMAYGLTRIERRRLVWLAPALALATSLYSVAVVVPAAYALPPQMEVGQVPASATRLGADLGQGITLLAAETETPETRPDGWVWLTLYWIADPVPPGSEELEAPEYVLEVLGRADAVIGKLQSYHGAGLYPASLWPPGLVVVERTAVRLAGDVTAPTLGRLNIKLAGYEDLSVDAAAIKVTPEEWPPPSAAALAELDGLWLTGAALSAGELRPGQTITVRLRWQVIRAPGRDLTTFVHLGVPAAPPLAQGDGTPVDGHYPTRLWAEGEVIVDDTYRLAIPTGLSPGRYPVHVGLYDPESGLRAPLTVNGERQPHDAYLVGWLRVID
jgi:hypothetical protein